MRLPNGYTELEYIQSTGAQWIDTGFKPNGNTKIVYDFHAYNQSTSQQGLFGSRPGDNGRFTLFTGRSTKSLQADYDTGQTLASETINIDSIDLTKRVIISMSNELVVNGTVIRSVTKKTFTSNRNLYLFANNNVGTEQLPASLRLYSCKIYNNDTLIYDYVPCINPDGEVGLYDIVNSKFYGNAGTGIFFAGPSRVSLPSGYKQLEYIQSSGTQYVDTGVRQNQNSRVVVDFQLVLAPASKYAWIFEGRDTGGKNRHSIYATKSTGSWHGGYGSASKNTNIPYDLSARIMVDFNKNILKIGNTSITFTQEVFQSLTSTVLFGCSTGGTIANYAQAKLFACRFFDGDTLLRDFIPCKNDAGAIGLYDLVNSKFYTNAGTGVFIAGPEVTWPSNDAIYVKVNGIWKQIDGIKIL